MKSIYNMLFPRKQENITNIKNDDDEINIILKQKKEKCCSFCGENNHNISKCEKINNELNKITDYCSHYENQTNIPKTRDFLEKINNIVINRYVIKHKIKSYMYYKCSQYYDNSVNNNIDLIIGYLCVLPLHPEIKIQRTKKQKIHEKQNIQDNNLGVGFVVGPNGINVGLGFMM